MSTNISDCGTKHLVEYDIRSKKHLKKLNGKYYKLSMEEDDLLLLNEKEDKHLIGKKIFVRSAAVCRLGDHVCPKCVGITASTNYDIADKTLQTVRLYSNIKKINSFNCGELLLGSNY